MGNVMVANAVARPYSLASTIESMYSLRYPLVEYILSCAGDIHMRPMNGCYTANDSRDRWMTKGL